MQKRAVRTKTPEEQPGVQLTMYGQIFYLPPGQTLASTPTRLQPPPPRPGAPPRAVVSRTEAWGAGPGGRPVLLQAGIDAMGAAAETLRAISDLKAKVAAAEKAVLLEQAKAAGSPPAALQSALSELQSELQGRTEAAQDGHLYETPTSSVKMRRSARPAARKAAAAAARKAAAAAARAARANGRAEQGSGKSSAFTSPANHNSNNKRSKVKAGLGESSGGSGGDKRRRKTAPLPALGQLLTQLGLRREGSAGDGDCLFHSLDTVNAPSPPGGGAGGGGSAPLAPMLRCTADVAAGHRLATANVLRQERASLMSGTTLAYMGAEYSTYGNFVDAFGRGDVDGHSGCRVPFPNHGAMRAASKALGVTFVVLEEAGFQDSANATLMADVFRPDLSYGPVTTVAELQPLVQQGARFVQYAGKHFDRLGPAT